MAQRQLDALEILGISFTRGDLREDLPGMSMVTAIDCVRSFLQQR